MANEALKKGDPVEVYLAGAWHKGWRFEAAIGREVHVTNPKNGGGTLVDRDDVRKDSVGPTSRPEVYASIDTERAYQDKRWNASTTTSEGQHSVTEFLVYMRDYVEEALHHVSRNADPGASAFALESVRKIATLGVACMEQHGAPVRR